MSIVVWWCNTAECKSPRGRTYAVCPGCRLKFLQVINGRAGTEDQSCNNVELNLPPGAQPCAGLCGCFITQVI